MDWTKGLSEKDFDLWIRTADSIIWLYLKNIISYEERDRLLQETEKTLKDNKARKKDGK